MRLLSCRSNLRWNLNWSDLKLSSTNVHQPVRKYFRFRIQLKYFAWYGSLGSDFDQRDSLQKKHADKMHDHPFKMPLSPYTNYVTLAF